MECKVVGMGPGNIKYCTGAGIEAVKSADIVLSSVKVSEEITGLANNFRLMKIMEIVSFIADMEDTDSKITVLASGDVGYYSIATTLRNHLGNKAYFELIPGISSMTLMSAKFNIGYEDMKLISLHGRDGSIRPYVAYNKKVFTLTGGKLGAREILKDLIDAGLTDVDVMIGERLSLPEEKLYRGKPEELINNTYDSLSVMIIVNENWVDSSVILSDDDYVRGKRPMTKDAVRNLSVDILNIGPKDLCWDVGAGTGGVTCAMARRAKESLVYAVEFEDEGIRLIEENIKKLGSYNIVPVHGMAPVALEYLPAPDRVFIGGSKGNLREIVKAALDKNPNAVFVVNSITLETLAETMEVFREFKLDDTVISITAAKSKNLGRYHMMMGENPIYIIKGEKIEDYK